MKRVAALALLIISSFLLCTAQQKEKRLPGTFLIYGPVHTIRDERVTVTVKNGQMVEGARTLVQTITYSEDGTKQERTLYLPNSSQPHKIVDLYNTDGKIIETTRFNPNGTVQTKEVINYDDQKRPIERISYWPDGVVMIRQTFSYNGNKRISQSTSYKRDGTIWVTGTATTDVPTNKTEILSYGPDRVTRSDISVTRTPEGGNLFERQTNGNFEQREKIIPFGKSGNERIQYNVDGTIRSRERTTVEVDSHGNFVKITRLVAKSDSEEFEPIEITYRTIEYYK
ncbi:MAG TPA: hypothetical protein VKB86_13965 [Pyrinomonadaceae bacterium]|nr:hypothetical protein [Pyrinomonadaceae bacterium]